MWSEDTQNLTRRVLQNVEFSFVTKEGFIPLKRLEHGQVILGQMHMNDALSNNYLIYDRAQDSGTWQYENVSDLIENGWAID
ncbi:hypothetical protein GCM10023187_39220 [Nibrella viscosa]|uniref:DUF2829 domain-containing protein n=1 Tax=Nibrella viscosa TaxID=1084524 RepID=A0ABP8KQ85_9BACT